MLLIKCKDCGKTIPVGYQQDWRSFEATNFTEHLEKCLNCGNVRSYFKVNYFFKESQK
jgi:translation initiation factor 2 beta subunit (eIF-2beta)/eIF-5